MIIVQEQRGKKKMENCKCADCANYINQWCRKVKDSPYPDLIRDCEYFHDIETNVEKIIRCKDCKHWDGVDTCDVIDAPVWDNDFCSMAERRSDG